MHCLIGADDLREYLRSRLVRVDLGLLIVGSRPLLGIITAASLVSTLACS
jgi:hypothetical protein